MEKREWRRDKFARVLIEADTLERVDAERIRATVRDHGLACVRGLLDRDKIRATRRRIAESFDPAKDRKHDPRDADAVRRNFQKLQIGANSGVNSQRTLGRFMRALFNPIFADDIYGMREHFVTLARFRNILAGQPADYAVHDSEDGYWTCARMLQYPRGGGFMVPHRDVYSQAAASGAGIPYFQPVLLLSEMPHDYQEGGGYVDHDDTRFHFEEFCFAGDLIVYDGRSMHGVADVDPMADLDLQTFSGRVVALVSLYKLLNRGADDYADLSRRGVTAAGIS